MSDVTKVLYFIGLCYELSKDNSNILVAAGADGAVKGDFVKMNGIMEVGK